MTRVLLVDDSPVMRRLFRQLLEQHPDLEIVGEAGDPFVARDVLLDKHPDVLVVDIEMPRMDGLTFLRRLMKHHPVPVVICSSLTTKGGAVFMEALDAGAAEVVCKPSPEYPLTEMGPALVRAVRSAAAVKRSPPRTEPVPVRPPAAFRGDPDRVVVAIASSTGGTTVVEQIVRQWPANAPALLVVQHLPPTFSGFFAARLGQLTKVPVREAVDGERVRSGTIIVARGDRHLAVQRGMDGVVVRVKEGPRVNGHRPAGDVLFHSLAQVCGSDAVGIVLTGMGNDGAKGLLAMRRAGARTLAQDEATSVVFGMPKVALELGAVDVGTPSGEVCVRALQAAEVASRQALVAAQSRFR